MTAYLILAFKNPHQLRRLITRLDSKNARIFVHVDKKVDITPFLSLCQVQNVRFVTNRLRIVWGGYSITKCIISGMKEILSEGDYEHIVLMSGQDYLVRPLHEFEQMLEANRDKSFMSVEADTPRSKWWYYARQRYRNYFLSDWSFKGKRYIHKVSRAVLPKRSFLYSDYTLYGGPGSTFCALSRQAAKYIVEFMEGNEEAARFAKTTFASDEFWFQTILMNSWLKDTIVNKQLWYMDWNGTSKHPRVLTIFDHDAIVDSQMFFARKFDVYQDKQILNKLDDRLQLNEKSFGRIKSGG